MGWQPVEHIAESQSDVVVNINVTAIITVTDKCKSNQIKSSGDKNYLLAPKTCDDIISILTNAEGNIEK